MTNVIENSEHGQMVAMFGASVALVDVYDMQLKFGGIRLTNCKTKH